MIAHAKGKFIRVSPSKLRPVINLIRGKGVLQSKAILAALNKGNKSNVVHVLDSAIANAKHKGLNEQQLFISKITADQGPVWSRFRATAFGRAAGIAKKTTHLVVELDLITK